MAESHLRTHDLARVLDAIDLAARAHHGQLRKGASGAPYVVHPLRVMVNLVRSGIVDPDMLCAAALHDTLEDTDLSAAVIADRFGDRVLSLVRELTKAPGLTGEASKQAVIASVPSMSANAQAIKLADVAANVRDVREDPAPSWSPDRKQSYVRYALGILAAISRPNEGLADALDDEVQTLRRGLAQCQGGPR